MPAEKVSAKAPKLGKGCAIDFNFGADLKEMASLFGENVVYSSAKSQITVGVQAAVRRGLEAGLSEKEIQSRMASYKPGVVSRLAPAVTTDAAVAHFEGLEPEAQAAMLAKLQSKQQGK